MESPPWDTLRRDTSFCDKILEATIGQLRANLTARVEWYLGFFYQFLIEKFL